MTYFAMLGLPEQFDLDPAELERRYVKAQREVHPDRFAQSSALEKRMATSRSLDVNQAYRTLKEPRLRAEYLLQLQGQGVTHSEKLATDPEILMESMGQREALMQAHTPADIHRLSAAANQHKEAMVSELQDLFQRRKIDQVKQVLLRLSYTEKFIEECRFKLQERV